MTTAQLHRTQSKTWEAIFPNEQITAQKSILFVKKLLAVAVSNITYLRAIFPEHAFADKCLEDLNLKILRDESACPGACQVIKWVKGCFDALDKKYIYVDPLKPETLIESYTFKFSYHNDGEVDIYRNNRKISSAYSAEETKKATVRLLRTMIILTNTMAALPDNVMMTMKLFYYDETTPTDYEPPGFKASTDSVFQFEEESTNIAVGEVSTPFHRVKMRVKTGSKQFEMHEDPIEEEMEQDKEQNLSISNAGLDSETDATRQPVSEVASEVVRSAPAFTNVDRLNQAHQISSSDQPDITSPCKPSNDEEEFQVRCPCGCNEDDGLMILCSICKFWQHGICFLITQEEKAPVNHICDMCAEPANAKLEPTDPYLCGLTSIAVQATCLWRRTLMVCTEFKRIVAPQLARRLGIENTVAQGLINRLEKEGFISNSNRSKKLGKIVNKDKINTEAVPRYLKTPKLCKQAKQSEGPDNLVEAMAKESLVQGNIVSKDVGALVDKTKKMSLSGGRRITRSFPAQPDAVSRLSPQENQGRKGRKRAYSKTDYKEFEVTDSQESSSTRSAKKKASIVQKDIAL